MDLIDKLRLDEMNRLLEEKAHVQLKTFGISTWSKWKY